VGQKDAGDGAGARLVKVPDESDAGFVPPKRSLGLHDHTVSAKIQRTQRTSIVINQGRCRQKKRARRSARSPNVLEGRC